MDLDIVTIPCLKDNYAYLVNGPDGVAVIDAPEAAPIIAALDARGWTPGVILITHHHWDHVQAIPDLVARYGCKVMGPEAEKDKLPPMDVYLPDGMTGGTGAGAMQVLCVPGHTLGHVAYYYPKATADHGALFSADSLMALGCGRLFEGSADQMWESLSKMAALPPETMVFSGHEYTASNAKFALSIEPQNPALKLRAEEIDKARAQGLPTAQVPLSVELATNPFLRASQPSVKALLGMENSSDAQVFAEIRSRKDRF